MRTATEKTAKSPTICLATESLESSETLSGQLSQLGCRCSNHYDLASLERSLEADAPSLVIVPLDFDGRCALRFCQDHPKLLNDVPVVFFATDPSKCFEKAVAAIRFGALDVLAAPLSIEKLQKIASAAHERSRTWPQPRVADFIVEKISSSTQSIGDGPGPSSAGASRSRSAGSGATVSGISGDGAASAGPASFGSTGHVTNGSQVFAAETAAGLASKRDAPPGSVSWNDTQSTRNPTSESGSRPAAAGPSVASAPLRGDGGTIESCPQLHARIVSHAARVRELEDSILGTSPAMQAVRSIIAEVAETKANVMIYGASGTGKELVATALHKLSDRSEGPFQPVNMTEIPHDLAESLLFGHERGSFTGAESRQIGVCEAADGGTLFLDEIGEMPLATQPKLLRFLQEGTVKRIGSRNIKKVDVRVITATNRTPETIVKMGLMREDLFFRLHVVPIHIPPLHQRPEDIEQLAMLFLQRYVKAYHRSVSGFTDEVLEIFRGHDWPGNVRQLENLIERLVVFSKGHLIDVPEIPAEIHAASMFDGVSLSRTDGSHEQTLDKSNPAAAADKDCEAAVAIASMSAIQRTERSAIIEALQLANGHVIDAANLLGLGQATVYRKIKQYHIPHQRRRRRPPK